MNYIFKELELPITYINGDYQVKIDKNGTKTRTYFDELHPKFPETIDLNISNYCEHNCSFCYISASKEGKHGDLNLPIFSQIRKGTEVAINFAKHPDLFDFLIRMRERKVIVNMTVNQKDLNDDFFIRVMKSGLITGLGISVSSLNNPYEFDHKHIVYHVIVGITPVSIIKQLVNENKNVLILGYKSKGRGINLTVQYDELKESIGEILQSKKAVSFDNLAIEQLNIKDIIPFEIWEKYYMGEEGSFSLYIDSVTKTFSLSSTETESFKLYYTIEECFREVQKLREDKNARK